MADVGDALYSRLSGFAGLTSLVGARIRPLRLRQEDPLEAVTYQQVTGTRTHLSGADDTVRGPRFQIDCWSAGYDTARAIAAQVVAALDRWSGTEAGMVIQQAFIEEERDLFEDQDAGIYRVLIEVVIWHE